MSILNPEATLSEVYWKFLPFENWSVDVTQLFFNHADTRPLKCMGKVFMLRHFCLYRPNKSQKLRKIFFSSMSHSARKCIKHVFRI